MELFTITCTTCQQRLKVRDASTIGEIQICPKCGSMVLVEPPEGWRETPADKPQVPAPQPSSPPQAASAEIDLSNGAAVASPPPVAAEMPPAPEVGPPDEFRAAGADFDAGIQSPPVQLPLAPPLEGDAPAAEPVLPTDAWTSEAAQQRRQWLMVGGAAFVGVALAFGVLAFFASRGARPDPEESAASAPAAVASAAPADPAQPQTPPVSAPADVARPAPEKTAAGTKAASAPEPSTPAVSPPVAGPPAKPADPPAAKTPGPENAKPTQTPPATAQPSAPDARPKPADPKKVSSDTTALDETLKAFAPFIDPDVNTAPTESMEAAQQDAPRLEPEAITTGQPAVPRPEPRQIDLPARLQDKIAEVEFVEVPLEAFLRFVMNFSTIPISLDPDALALVRATPGTKISVKKADATVEQLLMAALSPLQLGYVAVGQQLVVTRPPQPAGQLRTHSHAVSDLVGSDPQQLQQLADLIVEMVAPATWQAAGGPGVIREEMPALVIQQQDTVLFQAIVFCERLRAARGLPPQSKFNPELFSLQPAWARAAPRLARSVTLNFLQPASFTRILDRLSDEAGVEILVDWQALTTLGWTPDTETTLSVNQRPLGDVLSQMLQPLELTYRVVDATTVEVTSPAAVEARWDVEFYPVKKLETPGQTPEALVARVRRELSGDESSQLAGVLHFDAPSQHLIAALPQPLQRKLAEVLKKWSEGNP